jgi:DMSO reductase family type II enzyme chaperone
MTTILAEPEAAILEERDKESVLARSAAYALFSQLTCPPCSVADDPDHFLPGDLPYALEEIEEALPCDVDFYPLAKTAQRLSESAFNVLKAEYARLFETAGDDLPVPICESRARGRSVQSREELLSFYEFFGYTPRDEAQPDHLSVMLEFMHYLTWRESQEADPIEILSWQFAQRDFLERHLAWWFSQLLTGVQLNGSSLYYLRLFEALGAFLRADAAWQQQTIDATQNSVVQA